MKNIQFRPIKNNFLAKLKNDIKDINNRDELLVNADKSTDIFIQKTYMIQFQKLTKNLLEIKSITSIMKQKLPVKNEKLMIDYNKCKKQDHKEGFPHTLSCRLINPSQSDTGKISKSILDKINKAIVSTTKC